MTPQLLDFKSNINLANAQVPFTFVCKLIGMRDVDYGSSGAKIECPFGQLYHADGGLSKSFRIYDDVSGHCFACGETFTPVTLYARQLDIPLDDAADRLLEASGYKPKSSEERWAELLDPHESINQDALAEALKTYCARIDPDWEVKQFDEKVSAKLRQCLELLPNVTEAAHVQQWRTATKSVMTKILKETS